MQSQGSPPFLAILVIKATLPLDIGAMINRCFRRYKPGTASGHGRRSCQARVISALAASLRPVILKTVSTSSSARRCNPSRLVQGRAPCRTLSMKGRYLARQASAKASQSAVTPWTRPNCVPCWLLLRQSTTVPNTLKIRAFTSVTSIIMLLRMPTPTLVHGPVPLPRALGRQSLPVPGRGSTGPCHRMSRDTILAECPTLLRLTRHTARARQQTDGLMVSLPFLAVYVQPQERCTGLLEVDSHPGTGYGRTIDDALVTCLGNWR